MLGKVLNSIVKGDTLFTGSVKPCQGGETRVEFRKIA